MIKKIISTIPKIPLLVFLLLISCSSSPREKVDKKFVSNLKLYQTTLERVKEVDLPKNKTFYLSLKYKTNSSIEDEVAKKLAPLIEKDLVKGVTVLNNDSYHFLVKYYPSEVGTSYSHHISYCPEGSSLEKIKQLDQDIISRKNLKANWEYIITSRYSGF